MAKFKIDTDTTSNAQFTIKFNQATVTFQVTRVPGVPGLKSDDLYPIPIPTPKYRIPGYENPGNTGTQNMIPNTGVPVNSDSEF